MGRPRLPYGHIRLYNDPERMYPSMVVRLPVHISRELPPDQVYRIELTEQGILLAPVSDPTPQPAPPPAWTRPAKEPSP